MYLLSGWDYDYCLWITMTAELFIWLLNIPNRVKNLLLSNNSTCRIKFKIRWYLSILYSPLFNKMNLTKVNKYWIVPSNTDIKPNRPFLSRYIILEVVHYKIFKASFVYLTFSIITNIYSLWTWWFLQD